MSILEMRLYFFGGHAEPSRAFISSKSCGIGLLRHESHMYRRVCDKCTVGYVTHSALFPEDAVTSLLRCLEEGQLLELEGEEAVVNPLPIILKKLDGTYLLMVDKEQTVAVQDDQEALLLWETLFYILNLKTHKINMNTNWVLRSLIFCLKVEKMPSAGIRQSMRDVMERFGSL